VYFITAPELHNFNIRPLKFPGAVNIFYLDFIPESVKESPEE